MRWTKAADLKTNLIDNEQFSRPLSHREGWLTHEMLSPFGKYRKSSFGGFRGLYSLLIVNYLCILSTMKDYRLKKGQYTIEEALDKMFRSYHLTDKVDLSKIRTFWREIAGDTIHKYTTDLYLRKQVLYVKVSNSALKQELNYLKTTLKEAVNNYFKKQVVEEIVIN